MTVITKNRGNRDFVSDSLKFKKCGKHFIGANDKPFAVIAVGINNPERSPFRIHGGNPTQAPSGFAELISDDFPTRLRDSTAQR